MNKKSLSIRSHAGELKRLLLWALLVGTGAKLSAASLFPVACPGTNISTALRFAQPGDTIRIRGTCRERIAITTDRITLDGGGGAILDGAGVEPSAPEFNALLTIDGARGVRLKGLTVQNSSAEGILAQGGASLVLEDVTVQDNGYTGIAVSGNSTAEVSNCTSQGNRIGMDVFSGGTVILKGVVDIAHNVSSGVDVNGQSMLEIRGAQVQVNNNNGFGIVLGGSQLAIFGFSESQGSTLTVDGNGASGILLGTSSLEVFGASFSGSGANVITASNNMENGIWLPDAGQVISPFATARFVLENNRIGINFGQNSGGTIIGGLNVRNNQFTGLLADGAGALTLVSVPPNPSAIVDNGTDVRLRFGSRVTFGGAEIGSIRCDATVLTSGSTGCP